MGMVRWTCSGQFGVEGLLGTERRIRADTMGQSLALIIDRRITYSQQIHDNKGNSGRYQFCLQMFWSAKCNYGDSGFSKMTPGVGWVAS